MSNYDWTRFKKRISIRSSVADVYEQWATAAGMENWFLRKCVIADYSGAEKPGNELIEKGDHYAWYWHGWGDDAVEKGEILEANGNNFLQFSFGNVESNPMHCLVKIYTEENETICEIEQVNIPDDEKGKTHYHIGCMTGWNFYMTNMKSILEGGVDLRNKNENLKQVINA